MDKADERRLAQIVADRHGWTVEAVLAARDEHLRVQKLSGLPLLRYRYAAECRRLGVKEW